jgi:hypothetical protein
LAPKVFVIISVMFSMLCHYWYMPHQLCFVSFIPCVPLFPSTCCHSGYSIYLISILFPFLFHSILFTCPPPPYILFTSHCLHSLSAQGN